MPGLHAIERSGDAAKNTVQSYSLTEKKPLDSHKSLEKKQGITYAAQNNLPRLPIPDLESTCRRYLEALQPLQTPKEHDDTSIVVRDFLSSDGPYLQEKLKQYADDKPSYIEQFWYDSYLNTDNPVVLNLNPFFLLEDDPTPARNNQVNRAASLVISSLSFVRAVRKEELPPDTVRGQPLCMYQYLRLFGAARIPTENGCQIVQDPKSRHIVVLCRGQFYWFDVLDENSDLLMTEKNLARNLQIIIQNAQLTPIKDAAKGALGVLSTENRKTWSRLRDILSREQLSTNSECLEIVDSALFILSLDCTEPKSPAELCMTMLCGSSKVEKGVQIGTCTNRWYDKLQLIVCKNGSAGINFEHTSVDGHTVLRLASDVYTDTILRFARTINGQAPSLWASESPDPSKRILSNDERISTTPHKLEWDMIPELSTALRFAETRLADLIQQNEFQTLEFMGYGKSFITSHGFSPDAFVQMAFQAAYYGLYGRLECVYEPAMTKLYLHGRTEAIRSVTLESAEFVRTFWEERPANWKIDTLKRACQKHSEITKICAKAQGQDRHLFALYNIWQRVADDDSISSQSCKSETDGKGTLDMASASDPLSNANGTFDQEKLVCSPDSPVRSMRNLPSLFLDGGWDRLNSTILSTSNCGNPSLRQFGFGPTSGNGFGIGYIIKDGSISICASSKHRQTRRYIDAIESYFLEVRKLLRQVSQLDISGENGSHYPDCKVDGEMLQTSRRLNRGRIIQSNVKSSLAAALTTATNTMASMALSDTEASDADDFGGYGFFDSGLLTKSSHNQNENQSKVSRRRSGGGGAPRREIGKRLRLNEY